MTCRTTGYGMLMSSSPQEAMDLTAVAHLSAIKAGMGTSQDEMKKAVECGYWHLYRYDPRRIAEGKNPFQLDSKEPDTDKVMDFLMGENRFASLKNNFPDKADALYAKEVEDVKSRYARYKKLAED